MLATLNRWLGTSLIVLGVILTGFGVYLGGFAWLNDGARAGLTLLGTAGAFGAGFAITGFVLRFAAATHARGDPRRWWIQVAALLVGYIAFGLAAETSSFFDRLARP